MDERTILFYLNKFETSDFCEMAKKSWDYYYGKHDILLRKREAIGSDGEPTEVKNLPNNQIVDNVFARINDQKTNYLFGKPVTFTSDDDAYNDALTNIFNKKFHRIITAIGRESILCGISWIHPFYEKNGTLSFKRIPAYEMCPIWMDGEHTELGAGIRKYKTKIYDEDKRSEREITMVEVYTIDGVDTYEKKGNELIKTKTEPYAYLNVKYPDDHEEVEEFNWGRIPLIAFKSSDIELPIIMRAKSLQDGINEMLSDFQNNMQEDAGNSIMVLKNYDGEDLGAFRANLSLYRTVKVRTVDGGDGGVDTLQVEVNAENYNTIIKCLKTALIENMRGFDAKDDRLNGSPNEMNIQSAYSDMDLDANSMEIEYQASFEDLMYFINIYLANARIYSVDTVNPPVVSVMFNRDMLTNASTVIENCKNSVGIISNRTIVENHPFTTNVDDEMAQMEQEKQDSMQQMEQYQSMMTPNEDNTDDQQ